MKNWVVPVYERFGGFKVDANNISNLDAAKYQATITLWACKYEVGSCVEDALEMFRNWQIKPSEGNP